MFSKFRSCTNLTIKVAINVLIDHHSLKFEKGIEQVDQTLHMEEESFYMEKISINIYIFLIIRKASSSK